MKQTVAIIGGGPSALAAAAFIDTSRYQVTIYEKNKTLGRKFLVAGKGGFNLTHSEPIDQLIERYSNDPLIRSAVTAFTNEDLRTWLHSIGIPTYVGSSKRVYPEKGIKPIEVLSTILDELQARSVRFEFEKEWTGWNDQHQLTFADGQVVDADFTLFSLGGASWKVTGSDGSWLNKFNEKGIETIPFLPANCAYQVNWKQELLEKAEGMPLKNISIRSGEKTCKGEVVITKFGLEGNAIYALSDKIQSQLSLENHAAVYFDLKPSFTKEKIEEKLNRSGLKTTDALKNKLNLSKVHIHLLKSVLTKEEYTSTELLAEGIKHLPIKIEAAAKLDEAISTTGGIAMDAINPFFELKELKNQYCIGEMLDWNAPTGGYLLQACFSMGCFLADKLNNLG